MAYEDLLQVLAGRRAEAQQTNPFFSFGQAVQGISPVVQGASFKDNLGAVALQGLLSGVSTGFGRSQVDRQMTNEANALRGFLSQPQEVRSSSMFEPGSELAPYAQFLTAAGQKEQDALLARGQKLGDALALEKAKAILENPGRAARSGVDSVEIKPTNSGGFKVDWSGQVPMAQDVDSDIKPQGLAAREMALFQSFKEQGFPDTQAATAASKQLEAERKKMTRTFQAIEAARANAATIDEITRTAEQGIQGAGRTGPGSSDVLASVMGLVSQDQANKAAATTLLNSTKPGMLRLNKVPGMGAMSDFESKAFFAAGPGSDKTPEQNLALLGKMREAAAIERQYADFLEAYVEENGSDRGAQRAWEQQKKTVLGGGATGEWGGSQSPGVRQDLSAYSAEEIDFMRRKGFLK